MPTYDLQHEREMKLRKISVSTERLRLLNLAAKEMEEKIRHLNEEIVIIDSFIAEGKNRRPQLSQIKP